MQPIHEVFVLSLVLAALVKCGLNVSNNLSNILLGSFTLTLRNSLAQLQQRKEELWHHFDRVPVRRRAKDDGKDLCRMNVGVKIVVLPEDVPDFPVCNQFKIFEGGASLEQDVYQIALVADIAVGLFLQVHPMFSTIPNKHFLVLRQFSYVYRIFVV